jgi:site-specific recombinase XerD
MKLRIPYLQWRNGRPRWEPGPRLRADGWKGRDLKDDDGAWLELPGAIEAAKALNKDVESWRLNGGPLQRRIAPVKPARTGEHLWEVYRQSPRYAKKADSTRRDYANKIRPFLEEFGEFQVAALEKADLYRWWEELHHDRGHAMANGVLAVARAMLSYSTIIGWRKDNPAREMGLDSLPPRQVFWLPEELSAIVAAADQIGKPSVADAVVVALHSGQRQGDVLAMPRRIFVEQRIRLSQLKMRSRGGALIDAPMTPALEARIAAIRARREDVVIDPNEPLILREDNGRAYDVHLFRKAFSRVREAAAEHCPSVKEKRFQDLRDTAVTRLALAGCELPQIAAITGHTLTSITQIIKHYLVLQPEMADTAIKKLSTWLEAQGIVV